MTADELDHVRASGEGMPEPPEFRGVIGGPQPHLPDGEIVAVGEAEIVQEGSERARSVGLTAFHETYIVVSGAPSSRVGLSPDLATGPFEDIAAADQFRDALQSTVAGRHVVLKLHTPRGTR